MKPETLRFIKIFGIAGAAAALAACANIGDRAPRAAKLASADSSATTSVNKFLWRASLDTIDFMPLENADPMAGLISSEWYANPNMPTERFKTDVYILDTALRADALRVSVFRQQMTDHGWVDAPVNPATAREIENAILTRARELRLNSLDN